MNWSVARSLWGGFLIATLATAFGACASPRPPAAMGPAAGAGGAGAASAIPGASATAMVTADPGATMAAVGLDEGTGPAEPAALSTTRVTPDAPFRARRVWNSGGETNPD